MALLRLTQDTIDKGEYFIRARFEREGQGALGGKARVKFELGAQDREDLRWYLEDYLEYPFDPNPQIAARVEGRMEEIGRELFGSIFYANPRMRLVWGEVARQLNETRVEIHTEVAEATAIPWELLYAPQLADYVALRAAAFVRSYEEGRQAASLPQAQAGEPIRILLVICRPAGDKDVPFRSVGSRLVKGLKAEASQQVQLDVLRPPTFEQLGKVLQAALRAGKPYHVLHFDGHGTYIELPTAHQQAQELAQQLATLLDGVSADFFKAPRTGKHGYLLFEDPQKKQNMQLVNGRALGQLLVRCNVPVLVLNACRSAHADAPDEESGHPSTGSPSTGSSSTGSPSTGSPSASSPSASSPSTGSPSTGSPSASSPSAGSPSTGSPSTGSPSTGSGFVESGESGQGEVKSSAKKGLLSRVGGFLWRWVAGSRGEAQKMSHDVPSSSTAKRKQLKEQELPPEHSGSFEVKFPLGSEGTPGFGGVSSSISGQSERFAAFAAVFSGQEGLGQGDRTAERAYGSLAQEVMAQGVAGVVAMRYNLYVVTATRLVAEVYEALVQGYSLGAAVTYSRQQLVLYPTRYATYGSI